MRITTPLPDLMKDLPTDHRGFPIPYIVLRDNEGNPIFQANDEDKVTECLTKRKCHVCGKPLKREFWFIGGQLSAYHPKGAFNDGPTHKECGLFALKVCPYLAHTSYKAMDEEKGARFAKSLVGKTDMQHFVNPTLDQKRLLFFCFVKAKEFIVQTHSPVHRYIVPLRPYEQVEFFADGERIGKAHAKQLLQEAGEKCYLP